ncbi:MAG: hypothetical protein AB1772_01680 [Candidatus Zixiibacteriota bacterium]
MLVDNSLRRAILFGTAFVLGQFWGCNSDTGIDGPAPFVPNESEIKLNDYFDVNDNPLANNTDNAAVLHTWDDSHGRLYITKAASSYAVRSRMSDLESLGYRFSPDHSFELEDYGIPENSGRAILVRFVTIAMTYQPDPTRQAMYITYAECELG